MALAALSTIVVANGPYFSAASVAAILAEIVVLARVAGLYKQKKNGDFNNMKRKSKRFGY